MQCGVRHMMRMDIFARYRYRNPGLRAVSIHSSHLSGSCVGLGSFGGLGLDCLRRQLAFCLWHSLSVWSPVCLPDPSQKGQRSGTWGPVVASFEMAASSFILPGRYWEVQGRTPKRSAPGYHSSLEQGLAHCELWNTVHSVSSIPAGVLERK